MNGTTPRRDDDDVHQVAINAENPWPGLESFREQDEGFFNGRKEEIEALLRRVRRDRVTVLRGLSGLGKSSLLQAGLFPRLRAEMYLPVYVRLSYDESAPPLRNQVLTALATEAAAHGVDAPAFDANESLWEHVHHQATGYWSPDNRPVTPVLVFDQFEEAFTLGSEPANVARTAAFLDELGDLIESRPSGALKAEIDAERVSPREYAYDRNDYRVIIGIRDDFLGYIDTLQSQVSSLDVSHRMKLTPLGGRAATIVTAAGGEELVPPEVGELIVRLVAGETPDGPHQPLDRLVVDPALLSLFCRELNERRKAAARNDDRTHTPDTDGAARRSLTVDMVEVSRDQILKDFYERSVADLDPAVHVFIEDHLLTVDGYRNSEAIENALATPGITREAIDTLVRRRLIRQEKRGGRARIELTHDVLTPVVRACRDERRGREASAAAEAGVRHEAEHTKSRLRTTHRVMAGIVVAAILLAVLGTNAWRDSVAANDSLATAELSQAYLAVDRSDPADALAHVAAALRHSSPIAARGLAFRLLASEWWPTMFLDAGGRRSVTDAVFSPDGKQVATGYRDGETIVWSVANRDATARLRLSGHSPIASVRFSPDGRELVTASWDGVARVWDTHSGALLDSLPHRAGINSASFAPDGQSVITASDDSTARLWRSATGALVATLREDNRVLAAQLDGAGRYAIIVVDTAAPGYVLHVWSLAVPAHIQTSARVYDNPNSYHFGLEGTSVLTPSDGERPLPGASPARLIAIQRVLGAFVASGLGRTISTEVTGDGERIMRADRSGNVVIVNRSDGALLAKFSVPDDILSAAHMSVDGKYVVTVSTDRLARLWRCTDSGGVQVGPSFRLGNGRTSVTFSASGTRLLTLEDGIPSVRDIRATKSADDSLPGTTSPHFLADGRLVTVDRGRTGSVLRVRDMLGQPEQQEAVSLAIPGAVASDVSLHESRVAVLDTSGMISNWDIATQHLVGPRIEARIEFPSGRKFEPDEIHISPHGKYVLAVFNDTIGKTGRVRVWDVRTGHAVGGDFSHAHFIVMASFSPDDRTVLTASLDSTARLWNVTNGASLASPLRHLGVVRSARFSRDGRYVVTASNDATAQVWDAHTLTRVGPPLLHRRLVSDAEFSDDGSRVVTASWDGTAQVWGTLTGMPVGPAMDLAAVERGNSPKMVKAHFAPWDNARVVTVGNGGRAQLWDAQNGAPMGPAFGHGDNLSDAVFSPDGQILITTGGGVVRIWDVRTGLQGDAHELANFAEAVGGIGVAENGSDQRLTTAEITSRMRGFLAEAASPEKVAHGSFREFLRWYFGASRQAR